jgi:hypothetical protein
MVIWEQYYMSVGDMKNCFLHKNLTPILGLFNLFKMKSHIVDKGSEINRRVTENFWHGTLGLGKRITTQRL